MPGSPFPDTPGAGAPKAVWREWAAALRRTLPELSAELVAQVGPLLRAHGVRRVLAYHALPGEPEVAALGNEFELFTTRTHFRPERHLTIHPWASATEVSRAGYLQPPAGTPAVPLAEMDAVLLPALAYDRSGVRLGYGGGFYDRLLPGYCGLTVGVVWSPLLVPALPCEPHDIRAGWLATEQGTQKAAPADA